MTTDKELARSHILNAVPYKFIETPDTTGEVHKTWSRAEAKKFEEYQDEQLRKQLEPFYIDGKLILDGELRRIHEESRKVEIAKSKRGNRPVKSIGQHYYFIQSTCSCGKPISLIENVPELNKLRLGDSYETAYDNYPNIHTCSLNDGRLDFVVRNMMNEISNIKTALQHDKDEREKYGLFYGVR